MPAVKSSDIIDETICEILHSPN